MVLHNFSRQLGVSHRSGVIVCVGQLVRDDDDGRGAHTHSYLNNDGSNSGARTKVSHTQNQSNLLDNLPQRNLLESLVQNRVYSKYPSASSNDDSKLSTNHHQVDAGC